MQKLNNISSKQISINPNNISISIFSQAKHVPEKITLKINNPKNNLRKNRCCTCNFFYFMSAMYKFSYIYDFAELVALK